MTTLAYTLVQVDVNSSVVCSFDKFVFEFSDVFAREKIAKLDCLVCDVTPDYSSLFERTRNPLYLL